MWVANGAMCACRRPVTAPRNLGGAVAVEQKTSFGAEGRNGLVVKLDTRGDSVWRATLASNEDEAPRSVIDVPGKHRV